MTAALDLVAKHMSEDELLFNVLDLFAHFGVTTAHFRPARTNKGWRTAVQGDGKGFPDIVAVVGGRVIFRELKPEAGRLEPDQRRWRDVLLEHGQDWALWKPKQWLRGEIRAELEVLTMGGQHA